MKHRGSLATWSIIATFIAALMTVILVVGPEDEPQLPAPTPQAPDYEAFGESPAPFQVPPRAVPYANGRIPSSYLKPIYQGRLLSSAAASWNAMNVKRRAQGLSPLRPLGGLSSYRDFNGQVYLYRRCSRPGWCAVPGRSNHGWGLAIDLASQEMRAWINRYGSYYGWAKRCSDATWEWWHIKFNPGCTGAKWKGRDPGPSGKPRGPPTLRKGYVKPRKWTRLLQRRLARHGYKSVLRSTHYGKFDRWTRVRVKRFQKAKRLPTDGIVGQRSWQKLGIRR